MNTEGGGSQGSIRVNFPRRIVGGRAKDSMAEPLRGGHAKMVHSNLKTSQQVWTTSRGFEVTLSIWGSHGNFISLRAA